MSHVTKVLVKILMKRARHHIGPEIGMKQCGFLRGKGTGNAVQMLRTLTE